LVEFLPSKQVLTEPSVNPGETGIKGVPASGVKGGEEQVEPRDPDLNNPEEHESVEDIKKALNRMVYHSEQPPGAPDHTLSWGLTEWRTIARSDGKSKRTIEWVEAAVRMLQNHLGDVPLSAVGPREMRRFVIGLRGRRRYQDHPLIQGTGADKPLSDRTINNRVRGIKALYYGLAQAELISENPLRDYRAPKPGETTPATLTPEQIKLLLSQPDLKKPEQLRDFAMMALMYDSKCRVSELCRITMGDLEEKSFTVSGKGGRQLTYIFESDAARALARYRAIRPQPAPGVADYLFLTQKGRQLTRGRVLAIVKIYQKKAGITSRVSPHVFRHSSARDALRHGANLEEVRLMLNQRDIKSTQIYTRLENIDARKAQARYSPLNALGAVPKKKRRT
jgi:site-specific recombinase XerD